MNQTEIARLAEVTQQHISLILTGKRRPSWKIAKRLAGIFGRSPSFWMEASPDQMKEIIENGGGRNAESIGTDNIQHRGGSD